MDSKEKLIERIKNTEENIKTLKGLIANATRSEEIRNLKEELDAENRILVNMKNGLIRLNKGEKGDAFTLKAQREQYRMERELELQERARVKEEHDRAERKRQENLEHIRITMEEHRNENSANRQKMYDEYLITCVTCGCLTQRCNLSRGSYVCVSMIGGYDVNIPINGMMIFCNNCRPNMCQFGNCTANVIRGCCLRAKMSRHRCDPHDNTLCMMHRMNASHEDTFSVCMCESCNDMIYVVKNRRTDELFYEHSSGATLCALHHHRMGFRVKQHRFVEDESENITHDNGKEEDN